MPVITLWQPWATWIMWGWKTIETRTHRRFGCLLGSEIAIHAGSRFDPDCVVLAGKYLPIDQPPLPISGDLPFGAILGTACVKEFRILNQRDSRAALIDCANVDRWGLVLENVRPLEKPIITRGHQGIWYTGKIDE